MATNKEEQKQVIVMVAVIQAPVLVLVIDLVNIISINKT